MEGELRMDACWIGHELVNGGWGETYLDLGVLFCSFPFGRKGGYCVDDGSVFLENQGCMDD